MAGMCCSSRGRIPQPQLRMVVSALLSARHGVGWGGSSPRPCSPYSRTLSRCATKGSPFAGGAAGAASFSAASPTGWQASSLTSPRAPSGSDAAGGLAGAAAQRACTLQKKSLQVVGLQASSLTLLGSGFVTASVRQQTSGLNQCVG